MYTRVHVSYVLKKLAHHTTQLVGCNMFCKIYHILIIFKLVAFVSLSTLFYFLYFTEIAQKYRDGYTNVLVSQETLNDGIDPPFLTICMAPRTKNLILHNYKLSNGVLNEPNIDEKKILSSLNKTVEVLFREVTFKLNTDFDLYIKLWFYEEQHGWREYEGKMLEGNENYIMVRKSL